MKGMLHKPCITTATLEPLKSVTKSHPDLSGAGILHPPKQGYSPLFSSTVDTAWIKSGALDSVYSTKTSSSFSAVFTTRRNWKERVRLVIQQTTTFPDVRHDTGQDASAAIQI